MPAFLLLKNLAQDRSKSGVCIMTFRGGKKGFPQERVCNIVDVVPTFRFLTGRPVARQTEDAEGYRIREDLDWRHPSGLRADFTSQRA